MIIIEKKNRQIQNANHANTWLCLNCLGIDRCRKRFSRI